ncbi:hypothetical protein [Nostoc favosum]|uniref:ABC transporter permease n=1 Tax=Nostoc favosum CHAB5714 TaxID=2780399 RepID=A0ABS8IDK7_9NOSO|nr:hypothetical protein [Nostoc favosum]MCC5602305.1 hypothetical protein [Nostoc favosum CHAB5714]
MNYDISHKRNLHRFDPVAYLVIEKFRLSPLTFGLLAAVTATVVYLFTAWITDTLWSKQGQMGLLRDWIPWLLGLFINPVTLGYYLWSFQAIDKVIQELETSDVLETDQSEIDQFVINLYSKKWRKLSALASAIFFSTIVFITRPRLENSWTSSSLLATLTITIATFAVVYMGSMLVLNLITNIWIFYRIFGKKNLDINPLHPDRCGGLRCLSDYSLQTAYLVGVLGILIGVIEYQVITQGIEKELWFVHLVIPLYILLSMGCFFGPLLAAHSGMKRAKEESLHKIARQFRAEYSGIYTSLAEETEAFKKKSEKIQQLRALYTMTDELPVWPFDVKTFRRYLLTVPTPLIGSLIGIVQKLLINLLKQQGIKLG